MDDRGRFRLALGFAWGTSAGVAVGIFLLPLLGLDEGVALGAGVAVGALVGLGVGAWLARRVAKRS